MRVAARDLYSKPDTDYLHLNSVTFIDRRKVNVILTNLAQGKDCELASIADKRAPKKQHRPPWWLSRPNNVGVAAAMKRANASFWQA